MSIESFREQPSSPASFSPEWPSALRHAMAVVAIAFLLFGASALIYATGGTSYAYSYLILIPVILAAALYRLPGGLIAAVAAGLVLGPFMPLEVQLGATQETANWLVRLAMFLALGAFTGVLFGRLASANRAREMALRTANCGLRNQAALVADLSRSISASTKNGKTVGLVLVQVADLAEILRGIGADTGDTLISAIGKNLERGLAAPAQIYRFSATELVVLLEYHAPKELDRLVEQVTSTGEESVLVRDLPVRAQLVSGISYTRGCQVEPQELIRQIRVAVFEASEQQRPFYYYAAKFERNNSDSLLLVAQVKRALTAGEFVLYYQPKIRLSDGAVCGCEGLIRWRNPRQKMILPGLFMPKVERTTLIAPVTRFVATQASQFLRNSFAAPVSINFAVSNLFDDKLLQWLLQLAADEAMPTQALEIEITEGALIRDPEAAKRVIQRLKDAGIRVLLDDFGTGYSSFEHLRHLPISGLKIDRAFVQDLETDRRSHKLMACMIEVAHALDMTVTAEGVETAGQANLLRDLGCDLAQGFYYAKPMPEDDYEPWLQRYQDALPLRA
jgi:EAL domain-containing protein (putative c-di-GMP-specific phosphodiesterase class I)/GGDEF domain-containing protein